MIIFIYGEDTFRGRKKLKELKDKFTREIDPGQSSLTVIDGKTAKTKEIIDCFGARSLLAKKRMVIIENVFLNKNKDAPEEIFNYLKKLKSEKDDNIIVFWDPAIKTKAVGVKKNALLLDSDGRENPLPKVLEPLFIFLSKQPYAQEFKILPNLEMAAWVKKEVEARGGLITDRARQTLISLAGNDLWQLNNEIDKLINYEAGRENKLLASGETKKAKTISEETIRQLVRGGFDENIFALTDALSNRNKKLASELLRQQYEAGLSDGHLLNMITRQFRILLRVRQALDSRFTSRKIITTLKLHPFVAQKSINQVRNFNLANLKNALNKLIEIDYLVKTGRAEAKILLNLFIQKI
ncbi:MAG: DNA polymerase III subunit delta [Patescibacteria group bacterium]|nr:DNA polymerase III subunit delta [Patescibacteria group bacterium]